MQLVASGPVVASVQTMAERVNKLLPFFSATLVVDWQDLMYYPMKVRADLVMPTAPADWTQPDGVREHVRETGIHDVEVFYTAVYLLSADYLRRDLPVHFDENATGRTCHTKMADEEIHQTHELVVSTLKAKSPSLPARPKWWARRGWRIAG